MCDLVAFKTVAVLVLDAALGVDDMDLVALGERDALRVAVDERVVEPVRDAVRVAADAWPP